MPCGIIIHNTLVSSTCARAFLPSRSPLAARRSPMPSNRQPSRLQLPLDNLPPAQTPLLIDGRDPLGKDCHVWQRDELLLLAEGLDELARLGRFDEVLEQLLRRSGFQLCVGDAKAADLHHTLHDLGVGLVRRLLGF